MVVSIKAAPAFPAQVNNINLGLAKVDWTEGNVTRTVQYIALSLFEPCCDQTIEAENLQCAAIMRTSLTMTYTCMPLQPMLLLLSMQTVQSLQRGSSRAVTWCTCCTAARL